MERKYRVGLLGGTGMVGQRLATILENHPWFQVTAIAASKRSMGKTYEEALQDRWMMKKPVPAAMKDLVVADASDVDKVASEVDFVFCAIDLDKASTREIEDRYAMAEVPVVSNNSAHRMTPDVPMLIPEINPEHAEVIAAQRKRLGTTRGFVTVKSNCSIQSYVPAIHPLMDFGPKQVVVSTYQAISGAGKSFETWPEMIDNVIPYIGGEDEKSEQEPLKVWGKVIDGKIILAQSPCFTAQCIRVPVTDGHMAAVFISFERKPSKDEILARWREYAGEPQKLKLPSAPAQFLTYFEENDRPQTGLDREAGNGMGITLGRLREDSVFDYKFVGLSHNTLRGAAGGGVLAAELLCAKGYINAR